MAVTVEAIFRLRDQMSTGLRRISADAKRAESQLNDARKRADALERQLKLLDKAKARPEIMMRAVKARKDLLEMKAEMARLDKMVAHPRVEMDTKRAIAGVYGFRKEAQAILAKPVNLKVDVDSTTMSKFERLLRPLSSRGRLIESFQTTKIAGMIALIGNLAVVVAPLVTMVQALGMGILAAVPMLAALAGGFATVAAVGMPLMKELVTKYGDLKKAQEAVKNADTTAQRTAALKDLKKAQDALSPSQMRLINNVKELGKEWKKATAPIKNDLMDIANSAVSTAKRLVPHLAPEMKRFSTTTKGIAGRAEEGLTNPNQLRLMHQAFRPLPGLLNQMATAGGRIFQIFQGISIAAAPLARWILKEMNEWLGKIAKNFTTQGGIQKWRESFAKAAPILRGMMDLVINIWNNLKRLSDAGRPLVLPLLSALRLVVDAITDILIAFTHELGTHGFIAWWEDFARVIREIGMAMAKQIAIIWQFTGTIMKLFLGLPGPLKTAAAHLSAFFIVLKFFPGGGLALMGIKALTMFIAGPFVAALGAATVSTTGLQVALITSLTRAGYVGLAIAAVALLAAGIYFLSTRTRNLTSAQQEAATAAKVHARALDEVQSAANKTRSAMDRLRGIAGSVGSARAALLDAQAEHKRVQGDPDATKADRLRASAGVAQSRAALNAARKERGAATRGALSALQPHADALQNQAIGIRMQQEAARKRLTEITGPMAGLAHPKKGEADQIRGEMKNRSVEIKRIEDRVRSLRAQWAKTFGAAGVGTGGLVEKWFGKNAQGTMKALRADVERLGKPIETEPMVNAFTKAQEKIREQLTQTSTLAASTNSTLAGNAPTAPSAWLNGPGQLLNPNANQDATGGLVTQAQHLIVGERGPEAVVPLGAGYRHAANAVGRSARRRFGGGGGGGSTLIIENITVGSTSDLPKVEEALLRALRKAHANTPNVSNSEMFA